MGQALEKQQVPHDASIVTGDEALMKPKAHGTCDKAPQAKLRFGCDFATADRICCYNRHYAEHSGYFLEGRFVKETEKSATPVTYYDSVSGNPLFMAPMGRTYASFLAESKSHGWPSFRDAEVNWDYVRILKNGECVSTTGTHLGHNLPDERGNRYCINLVSVAGRPPPADPPLTGPSKKK